MELCDKCQKLTPVTIKMTARKSVKGSGDESDSEAEGATVQDGGGSEREEGSEEEEGDQDEFGPGAIIWAR